jgi:hypothetical protein
MNVDTPKSSDDAFLNVLLTLFNAPLTLLTTPSTLLHAPWKVFEHP